MNKVERLEIKKEALSLQKFPTVPVPFATSSFFCFGRVTLFCLLAVHFSPTSHVLFVPFSGRITLENFPSRSASCSKTSRSYARTFSRVTYLPSPERTYPSKLARCPSAPRVARCASRSPYHRLGHLPTIRRGRLIPYNGPWSSPVLQTLVATCNPSRRCAHTSSRPSDSRSTSVSWS